MARMERRALATGASGTRATETRAGGSDVSRAIRESVTTGERRTTAGDSMSIVIGIKRVAAGADPRWAVGALVVGAGARSVKSHVKCVSTTAT